MASLPQHCGRFALALGGLAGVALAASVSVPVEAAAVKKLTVRVDGFKNGERDPDRLRVLRAGGNRAIRPTAPTRTPHQMVEGAGRHPVLRHHHRRHRGSLGVRRRRQGRQDDPRQPQADRFLPHGARRHPGDQDRARRGRGCRAPSRPAARRRDRRANGVRGINDYTGRLRRRCQDGRQLRRL